MYSGVLVFSYFFFCFQRKIRYPNNHLNWSSDIIIDFSVNIRTILKILEKIFAVSRKTSLKFLSLVLFRTKKVRLSRVRTANISSENLVLIQ